MSFYKKSENSYNFSFMRSVNAALEGIVHTLLSERNMRVHFIMGFLVIAAGIYFNLSAVEMILVVVAVTFVLVTEMLNTAIEYMSDIVTKEEFHPTVKTVKDIAAGAVFVSSVNAMITGYIVISGKIGISTGEILLKIKQTPRHVALIAILFCVGLVLLIKTVRREKNLLRGGMPSGHTAVAFAVWMSVSMLTLNSIASFLVLVLALVIARSRMVNGVHSLSEVAAGAILGAAVALLVFQILA